AMSFTMEDFQRQYAKEHFAQLTPEERREALESLPPDERRQVLQSLPPEERLAGLSAEQIRQYLNQLSAGRSAGGRKPRRKTCKAPTAEPPVMTCMVWVGLCCLVVVLGGGWFARRGRADEPKGEQWARIDQTQYVGAKKCAECHKNYYDVWKDSPHNKMIRKA